MADVLFCKAVICSRDNQALYLNTLTKLIETPRLKGLNLERLGDSDIWSVRFNKKGRLLFKIANVNKKRYLLLLKPLPNHEYEKEKVLITTGASNFLAKNHDEVSNTITGEANSSLVVLERETSHEDLFSLLDDLRTKLSNSEPLKLKKTQYLDTKYIIFNEAQEKSHEVHLPFILNGIAGSGKTLVFLSLLKQALLEDVKEDGHNKLVYTAPLDKLVIEFKNAFCRTLENEDISYESFDKYIECNDKKVFFLTTNELINEALPFDVNTKINQSEILTLIENKIKTQSRNQKKKNQKKTATKSEKACSKSPETVLQELERIIGLPGEMNDKFAHYYNLGERQSIFYDESDKRWMIEFVQIITQDLEALGKIYPPFYIPPLSSFYDGIFVDESQGLSLAIIAMLGQLCNQKIILATDTNQNWQTSITDVLLYKHFLRLNGFELPIVDLTLSYRNATNVALVANNVLRLKSHLMAANHHHEAQQVIPASNQMGQLTVVDEAYIRENGTNYQSVINSPHSAVIVFNESDLEDAKSQFKLHRIFLYDAIQGLEYENILLFRPFSAYMLRQFEHVFSNDLLDSTKQVIRIHRTKHKEMNSENEIINQHLKKLFIGTTRAISHLYLIQDNLGPKNHLVAQILFANSCTSTPWRESGEKISAKESLNHQPQSPTNEVKKTKNSWKKEAQLLLMTNNPDNIERAKLILLEECNFSNRDIEKFIFNNKGLIQSSSKIKAKDKDEKKPSSKNEPELLNISDEIPALSASLTASQEKNQRSQKNTIATPKKTNAQQRLNLPSHLWGANKERHSSSNKYSIAEMNTMRIAAEEIFDQVLHLKKEYRSESYQMTEQNEASYINEICALFENGVKSYLERPQWFLDDEELTKILILEFSPMIYKLNIDKWKNNKDITHVAVMKLGALYKDASESLQSDNQICIAAIKSYPRVFSSIPKKNKQEELIATLAIAHVPELISELDESCPKYHALKYMANIKCNDFRLKEKQRIEDLWKTQALIDDDRLDYQLQNKAFALNALIYFPEKYQLLHKDLRKDLSLFLRAVIFEPKNIEFADKKLQDNPDIQEICQAESKFNRYRLSIRLDSTILNCAANTFVTLPSALFDLAMEALQVDKSAIIYVYRYLANYLSDLLKEDIVKFHSTFPSLDLIHKILDFYRNSFPFNDYFINYKLHLNGLLSDVFKRLGKDKIKFLVEDVDDLIALINLSYHLKEGDYFFSLSQLIAEIFEVDFLMSDYYSLIIDAFIDEEKLNHFFIDNKSIIEFIKILFKDYNLLDAAPYKAFLNRFSLSMLANNCHCKNDFESMISCLVLSLDFGKANMAESEVASEMVPLIDFIQAIDSDLLKRLYADNDLNFEGFLVAINAFGTDIHMTNYQIMNDYFKMCFDTFEEKILGQPLSPTLIAMI